MNKFAVLAVAILAALSGMGAAPVAPAAPAPEAALTMEGFGAVRIGMTIPEAERALGTHLKMVYLEENDPNACGSGERADGKNPDVFYMVEDKHIVRIDVTKLDEGTPSNPPVRTAAHIGIGSTEAEIRKAYGARVKVQPHPYLEQSGHYMVVKSADGKTGIIFETENGKVVSFRAGAYPAVGYIEGCA